MISSAISALDIALWDIKGKALGVPVYELLGGRTRDKVRVYASPMTKEQDPRALAESYVQLKEMGFTAAKIFVNGPISSRTDGRNSSAAATRTNWTRCASAGKRWAMTSTLSWKYTGA